MNHSPIPPDPDRSSSLTPAEKQLWDTTLQAINRNNVFCHCRQCDREWVGSKPDRCDCGSRDIEWLLCWQFPDD